MRHYRGFLLGFLSVAVIASTFCTYQFTRRNLEVSLENFDQLKVGVKISQLKRLFGEPKTSKNELSGAVIYEWIGPNGSLTVRGHDDFAIAAGFLSNDGVATGRILAEPSGTIQVEESTFSRWCRWLFTPFCTP